MDHTYVSAIKASSVTYRQNGYLVTEVEIQQCNSPENLEKGLWQMIPSEIYLLKKKDNRFH